MENIMGRYRNLIVLVGVLFAQVLGLAVQVKRTTEGGSSHLIRIWAVGAVTPLEKVLVWAQTSTGNLWHNYLYLRGVRAENRELKQEIERMRLEQARMTQDADQAHRLQALLGFKEQFISQTLAAQVIGSTGSELSRSVYIDKGKNDGIKRDMAVITKDGIVGKVLYVYPSTALVLLIDDQTSGVGAILENERLQGILRGTPSGEVALEKVMSDETVPVGEEVLTSGGDGIFPKGLPVGKVVKVSPGNDLFLNIRVRPSVNLARLEEVLVVTKIDERQALPAQSGPMRAVDILAERLPSVPAKAENAASATGRNPTASGPANVSTPTPASPKSASPSAEIKPKPAPGRASGSTAAAGVAAQGGALTPAEVKSTTAPHSTAPEAASSVVKKAVASGDTSASVSSTATSPSVTTSTPAIAVKKTAPKPDDSAAPKPQPAVQDTPQ